MRISQSFQSIVRRGYRLSLIGQGRSDHITRHRMYKTIRSLSIPINSGERVLSISHSQELAKLLGFSEQQIINANYPEENILNLSYRDSTFDALVSDQVLEHIEGDPFTAIAESFRVVKPGGVVCHTTCFINPIHGHPNDYWRFTTDALRLLVGVKGEIIQLGAWGNYWVWSFCKMGLRYEPIPITRYHPARWLAEYNEPEWPVTVWVIARKR